MSPGDGETVDVAAGELFWQTHEGGRKGGGVYYTPELVRHLVGRSSSALESHLEEVARTGGPRPAPPPATVRLPGPGPGLRQRPFPRRGLDQLADRIARFLAETPLPAVRDELERCGPGRARLRRPRSSTGTCCSASS